MSITETNVATLRANLADAIRTANNGTAVIVTQRVGSGVVMIDRDAYEDYLAATNPRLQKKVAAARAEIAAGDTVTLEDLMNK